MFLQFIGFLLLVGLMLKVSGIYFLVALNGLGKWNIGGVPNSAITKLLIVLALIPYCYAWYLIYKYAPFNVIIKPA